MTPSVGEGRRVSGRGNHAEPVARSRVGSADVDAVEAIADGLRRSEYAHGGGLCYAAAVAQLQQVRSFEDAACPPEVRTRLLLATADLAEVAGSMAYDVDQHDAARRLWTLALDTARRAEDHPRSTDLAVEVLLNMAHQALHLDRPREALQRAVGVGHGREPHASRRRADAGLRFRFPGVVPGRPG